MYYIITFFVIILPFLGCLFTKCGKRYVRGKGIQDRMEALKFGVVG
jgi:hypothetical protein